VLEVNKPPVIVASHVSFSTPALTSPGVLVGFPLSRLVTDPDVTVPFNVLAFTLSTGSCGASTLPRGQSPLTINTNSGQLFISSAVASQPMTDWPSPFDCCVVATDGGGLNASVSVSITFTEVALELSVFPSAVTINHYTLGLSTTNISVSFFAGSHIGVTWAASVASLAWLNIVQQSNDQITLQFKSTAVGGSVQGSAPFTAFVSVASTGMDYYSTETDCM
jgi:hypothetical protein